MYIYTRVATIRTSTIVLSRQVVIFLIKINPTTTAINTYT